MTGTDRMRNRIEQELRAAGEREMFVTGKQLVRILGVESADPLRQVKRRIEALKDEGCPIVGLPEFPGPGFTWVHDAESEWGRKVLKACEADMGSRISKMARHLAGLRRMSEQEARQQLALGLG